jgi:stage II sporulation protein R
MNIKKKLGILLIVIIAVSGLVGYYRVSYAGNLEAVTEGISESIIRFHVRANSDSQEDQEVKLKVKEAVVDYIRPALSESDSLSESRAILEAERDNIRNVAIKTLRDNGFMEDVSVYFEKSYFPVKSYGDVTFPAGYYEAFRVDIGDAEIFLGGVSMIANDAVHFVKNDLLIYGISLIFIFIFVLYYIFRSFRWVFIVLFICFISILSTSGILGIFSWEVTVISSNFVALQLIITMSMVVHLVERYKELYFKYKNASQYKLTINTVLSKLIPSFFAIITTVVGFSSLVLSNIEPVINLGLMMSVGILVSLVLTFIYFNDSINAYSNALS